MQNRPLICRLQQAICSVRSIVDPSSSLLNFKPVITGVGAVLQLYMLNLFKTSLAYLYYDIKIPLSDY